MTRKHIYSNQAMGLSVLGAHSWHNPTTIKKGLNILILVKWLTIMEEKRSNHKREMKWLTSETGIFPRKGRKSFRGTESAVTTRSETSKLKEAKQFFSFSSPFLQHFCSLSIKSNSQIRKINESRIQSRSTVVMLVLRRFATWGTCGNLFFFFFVFFSRHTIKTIYILFKIYEFKIIKYIKFITLLVYYCVIIINL